MCDHGPALSPAGTLWQPRSRRPPPAAHDPPPASRPPSLPCPAPPRPPGAPERSRAKELCPQLIVVPFMFDQYEAVSEKASRGRGRGAVQGGGRCTAGSCTSGPSQAAPRPRAFRSACSPCLPASGVQPFNPVTLAASPAARRAGVSHPAAPHLRHPAAELRRGVPGRHGWVGVEGGERPGGWVAQRAPLAQSAPASCCLLPAPPAPSLPSPRPCAALTPCLQAPTSSSPRCPPGLGDPGAIAAAIRDEIRAEARCSASAGIGPNLLLARIATEHAKPDGQLAVAQGEAARYLQVGGRVGG